MKTPIIQPRTARDRDTKRPRGREGRKNERERERKSESEEERSNDRERGVLVAHSEHELLTQQRLSRACSEQGRTADCTQTVRFAGHYVEPNRLTSKFAAIKCQKGDPVCSR